MSEYQKPFTKEGRDNYNKCFCPFSHIMGDEYELHDDCAECPAENDFSFLACKVKYKESTERGKGK
jgi:hypothetical protein